MASSISPDLQEQIDELEKELDYYQRIVEFAKCEISQASATNRPLVIMESKLKMQHPMQEIRRIKARLRGLRMLAYGRPDGPARSSGREEPKSLGNSMFNLDNSEFVEAGKTAGKTPVKKKKGEMSKPSAAGLASLLSGNILNIPIKTPKSSTAQRKKMIPTDREKTRQSTGHMPQALKLFDMFFNKPKSPPKTSKTPFGSSATDKSQDLFSSFKDDVAGTGAASSLFGGGMMEEPQMSEDDLMAMLFNDEDIPDTTNWGPYVEPVTTISNTPDGATVTTTVAETPTVTETTTRIVKTAMPMTSTPMTTTTISIPSQQEEPQMSEDDLMAMLFNDEDIPDTTNWGPYVEPVTTISNTPDGATVTTTVAETPTVTETTTRIVKTAMPVTSTPVMKKTISIALQQDEPQMSEDDLLAALFNDEDIPDTTNWGPYVEPVTTTISTTPEGETVTTTVAETPTTTNTTTRIVKTAKSKMRRSASSTNLGSTNAAVGDLTSLLFGGGGAVPKKPVIVPQAKSTPVKRKATSPPKGQPAAKKQTTVTAANLPNAYFRITHAIQTIERKLSPLRMLVASATTPLGKAELQAELDALLKERDALNAELKGLKKRSD